jgi:hypothetical protein
MKVKGLRVEKTKFTSQNQNSIKVFPQTGPKKKKKTNKTRI